MKKYLVVILILIFSITGCKKNVDMETLKEEYGAYRNLKDGSLFTGKALLKNDEGKVMLEINCVYGLLHGKLKEYNEDNGVVVLEENYVEGKLDGESKEYFISEEDFNGKKVENGSVASMKKYKNGEMQERISYYPDGKVYWKMTYKSGGTEREESIYYSNGVLYSTRYYKNGKLDGTVKSYKSDGNLESEAIFENDILIEKKVFN